MCTLLILVLIHEPITAQKACLELTEDYVNILLYVRNSITDAGSWKEFFGTEIYQGSGFLQLCPQDCVALDCCPQLVREDIQTHLRATIKEI